jgi:uncharacterized damage-inducible protein DinB
MDHFPLMARFNGWVNEHVYAAVAQLDDAKYRADCGLFFGSLHATLNHILVVDRLWTGRVEGVDRGIKTLNQILYDDLPSLGAARREEDARMVALMDRLTPTQLQETVRYGTADGKRRMEARRWDMLAGMFNHQTHHRGQIYAVLMQNGIRLPDIDLIYYLAETGQARYVA